MQKIMIIEDDAVIRDELSLLLENEGYQAVPVQDFTDVPGQAREKQPDLILLDYEMPVCDGKMTLEMIRADEEMKDIPVVFLTAVNDRANIEAVLKLKPAGYFLKPAVKDKLIADIEKILGQ